MKSKSSETAQDIPHNRTVLKRISDNFWVPCKDNSMARPVLLTKDRKCHFCKIKENNKLKYGPLYELNRVVAHYYCVLCSTRMKQNGKDNEGIMGFLIRDINLELRRSKKIICAYCREANATVECGHQGCKKVFHFPCGLQRGAISRFRNDFVTFCCQHRPKQRVPKKILDEALKSELICAICYEEVQPTNRKDNLWAPCCLRTWYHRNCVQKLAHSSGYFFRCAICNDAGKFKSHMEDNGVFVPQQDASWELVPNAYEELLVRHNRCDADECKCPEGREENEEDTRWEIILCRYCGSQGMHVGCGNLKFSDPQWECPTCRSIVKPDSKSSRRSSALSNDQPGEAAPRKRKLSRRAKTRNKKKKENGEGALSGGVDEREPSDDDSDDDSDEPNSGARGSDDKEAQSSDEFYIRIPDFVTRGRDSDKPHTATRPDEESDEEVDVISVDTAWLMVEEVLSRVKPGPLSFKLKFLRKKVFAYHFDPFDIREEEIETIDLTSDSEDNTTVFEADKKSDADSDIEFIGEVRNSSNKEKSRQESIKMEPNSLFDESQDAPEMPNPAEGGAAPEVPELSDTESVQDHQIFEGARASDGSEAANEPMVSDVSQGSDAQEMYEGAAEGPEALRYVVFPEFPEVRPSTSKMATEYESAMSAACEKLNPYDEEDEVDESDVEYFYGRRGYGGVDYEVQEQKSEDISPDDEENTEEAGQRQIGKKHPASGIEYYQKVKRARTATTTDNSAVAGSSQYETPAQNLSPSAPPSSQPVPICDPSSNLVFSMGQAIDDNQSVIKGLNLTGLRIMDPSGLPTVLLPNTSYVLIDYGDNGGQTLLNASVAPSTSTTYICEPSTSEMATSLPSTSEMAACFPSTSGMAASFPSTSGMAASFPSTSGMAASFPSTSGMAASYPSTSGMAASFPSTSLPLISGMATSLPSISGMAESLPSHSGMPLTVASTSGMTTSLPSLSGREDESGSSSPLPSFQFLSSLKPNMPPIPSSNSSSSVSLNLSQRVAQSMENSSSSEGSNDVFITDDSVSQKPAS